MGSAGGKRNGGTGPQGDSAAGTATGRGRAAVVETTRRHYFASCCQRKV